MCELYMHSIVFKCASYYSEFGDGSCMQEGCNGKYNMHHCVLYC